MSLVSTNMMLRFITDVIQIEEFTRHFTIPILKISGSHFSPTRPILHIRGWKSIDRDMPGESYWKVLREHGLIIRRYVRASMTLAGLLPPLSDNGNSKSYSLWPIATRLTTSAGRWRIHGQYPYRPTPINRYPRRHSSRRRCSGRYLSEKLWRFSIRMVDLPKQVEPILRKDSPVHDGDIGSSCLVRHSLSLRV